MRRDSRTTPRVIKSFIAPSFRKFVRLADGDYTYGRQRVQHRERYLPRRHPNNAPPGAHRCVIFLKVPFEPRPSVASYPVAPLYL